MLEILASVEKDLPHLLLDESAWSGLFIDYHPPTVERLWMRWQDCRISLHRIHPCDPGQALFHPHPWPSAMHILSGEYEMAVGYGKGETLPPVAALMIAKGDFRYEMTDPDAWHSARPHVAARLLHLPLEEIVQMRPVCWHDPAALDEEFRQRAVLAASPQSAGLDELSRVNQACLQGQYPEQKVAVRVHVLIIRSCAGSVPSSPRITQGVRLPISCCGHQRLPQAALRE